MFEPSRSISLKIEAGRKAMIPIMMMSEMPFPIPFSVIRSPSHITKTVPAVRQITVETMNRPRPITIEPGALVARRLIA